MSPLAKNVPDAWSEHRYSWKEFWEY